MKQRALRNQKGFTLVEIAIVLVIIGLLLGGVLKGQEMIKQAKVKKVMKITDEVRSAIALYLDKVGDLPYTPGTATTYNSTLIFTALAKENVVNSKTPPKDPFGGTINFKEYTTDILGTNTKGSYIVFPGVGDYTDVSDQLDLKFDDDDTATGSMGLDGTDFIVTL